MIRRTFISFVLVCLPVVTIAATEHHAKSVDAAAGGQAAAVCAGCHGPTGQSVADLFPSLAGQNPKYLIKQIKDFKTAAREDAVMNAQVSAMSEQTMMNIAAFYAEQAPATGMADAQMVGLGELLYRGGNLEKQISACAACHGPTGAGNPAAGFAQLSGQQVGYTVKQLQAFREGLRTNDPNNVMGSIAQRMSNKEIRAVAEYIHGLSP